METNPRQPTYEARVLATVQPTLKLAGWIQRNKAYLNLVEHAQGLPTLSHSYLPPFLYLVLCFLIRGKNMGDRIPSVLFINKLRNTNKL